MASVSSRLKLLQNTFPNDDITSVINENTNTNEKTNENTNKNTNKIIKQHLISIAGETISLIPTGLSQTESTLLDISGFTVFYVPENFSDAEKSILLETVQFIFPLNKLTKKDEDFVLPCEQSQIDIVLDSLSYRLQNLRESIQNDVFLSGSVDTVEVRQKIDHFKRLDTLIESLKINKCDSTKRVLDESNAKNERIRKLLRRFAYLIIESDKQNKITESLVKGVENYDKEIDIDEYIKKVEKEDKDKDTINPYIQSLISQTKSGQKGGALENDIGSLDTTIDLLSTEIDELENKETLTKKQTQLLRSLTQKLTKTSKKREALLSELDTLAESKEPRQTVSWPHIVEFVDGTHPSLKKSNFLKFEKDLLLKIDGPK